MEEAAARRIGVSNVVTACSRSVVERKEGREGMERLRMVRKSGQFACL